MTTQPENNEDELDIVRDMRNRLLEFIESSERAAETREENFGRLRDLINTVDDKVDAHSDARRVEFDALHEFIKEVDAKVDAQGRFIDAVSNTSEATETVLNTVNRGLAEWMTKLESFEGKVDSLQHKFGTMETKFDGIRDDLALVKGGHARNAMVHNLPRIADEFGFEFISEMPQATVIEFAKMAKALGEEESQIASFKNADMVMHVLDSNKQPAYVAVEASFTVDSSDIVRAVRNAGYLSRFTGLPAFAAVAGVAVMPEAQTEVDSGKAFLYKIKPGELQSE